MVNLEIKLSPSFFKEESQNGFLISKTRKELWAIELDLLWQFRKICEKYKLTYWLDGGTLLGAVRHGGFIPWDDDIDITMPRKDYDKFVQYASKELKYPYFLQNDWTDSTFYCWSTRILEGRIFYLPVYWSVVCNMGECDKFH